MKIIIDDKIPYIKEAAEKIADEAIYAPGKDFTRELVQDADALIIRTRTHCNRELLEGSKVKFIATATIGFDHIDTEYCKQAGIEWANAPGTADDTYQDSIGTVQAIEEENVLFEQADGNQFMISKDSVDDIEKLQEGDQIQNG